MSRDGFVENTMGSIRTWAAQQTPATSNIVSDSIREDGAASIRGGDVFHEANGDGSNLPTSDSASAIFDSSAVSTIGRTMKRGRSGSIASSLREKIAAHGSTPALVSSQVASITSASASSVALNTPGGSMGDPRPSISRFGSSSTSLGAGSFVLSKSWVYDMESLLKVRSLSCVRLVYSESFVSFRLNRTCTPPLKHSVSFSPSARSSLPLTSTVLAPAFARRPAPSLEDSVSGPTPPTP